MKVLRLVGLALSLFVVSAPMALDAQGPASDADYVRAFGLRDKYVAAARASSIRRHSSRTRTRSGIGGPSRAGNQFVIVDAETRQKRPAFDHGEDGRVVVEGDR